MRIAFPLLAACGISLVAATTVFASGGSEHSSQTVPLPPGSTPLPPPAPAPTPAGTPAPGATPGY